ncbi:MAG: hypothetical protein ACPGWR_25615, partial [Ardenticatenaceae bacterium]
TSRDACSTGRNKQGCVFYLLNKQGCVFYLLNKQGCVFYLRCMNKQGCVFYPRGMNKQGCVFYPLRGALSAKPCVMYRRCLMSKD